MVSVHQLGPPLPDWETVTECWKHKQKSKNKQKNKGTFSSSHIKHRQNLKFSIASPEGHLVYTYV